MLGVLQTARVVGLWILSVADHLAPGGAFAWSKVSWLVSEPKRPLMLREENLIPRKVNRSSPLQL